jgi:hypothetical protein
MARDLELTEAQVAAMDAAIARSRNGQMRSPSAPIDPYDRRQAEADIVRGRDRDPDVWRQIMERTGFAWFDPHRMNREVGPMIGLDDGVARLHTEGQWRCGARRMAFTIKELCANFGSPERFAMWLEQQDMEQQARRAGLVLPRR